MVDLMLTSINSENLPKDMYVAVRIGEAQKLGRLSNERLYKFPSSITGDHQFGKIEFLRKVGSCTVGVVPEKHEQQEVDLPIDTGNLRFNVVLKKPELKSGSDKPPAKVLKEDKPRVLKAKQYLEDHDLERRLKDVMQDVISVMPDDPALFIYQLMTKNNNVKRLQTPNEPPKDSTDATQAVPDTNALTETDALRLKAREALAMATSDGRLDSALQDQRNAPLSQEPDKEQVVAELDGRTDELQTDPDANDLSEADALRLKGTLREALATATSDGRLDSALQRTLSQEPDKEQDDHLRLQAKNTLLAAYENGALDSTLQSLTQARNEIGQSGAEPSHPSSDELRLHAKQTLVAAHADGRLQAAFDGFIEDAHPTPTKAQEASVVAPSENIDVRMRAMQTLVEANADGRLEGALETVKQRKHEEDPPRPPPPPISAPPPPSSPPPSCGPQEGDQLGLKALIISNVSTSVEAIAPSAESTPAPPLVAELNRQTEEASVVETSEDDDVRLRAKQALLDANKDGRLAGALESFKQRKDDEKDTSSLPQPLAVEASGDDDMLMRAKQVLLDANEDGRLMAALESFTQRKDDKKDPPSLPPPIAPPPLPPSPKDANIKNMQLLIEANADDRVIGALETFQQRSPKKKDDKKTQPQGSDQLCSKAQEASVLETSGESDMRIQARQALIDANTDGRLEGALKSLQRKDDEKDQPERSEQLRLKAKRSLLDATVNGQLDKALSNMKTVESSKESTEELRSQTKSLLANASISGQLEEALTKSADPGDIKEKARSILTNAAYSGNLRSALQDVSPKPKRSSDDTSLETERSSDEELRQHAKQVFLEAVSSGCLEDALNKMAQTSPDKCALPDAQLRQDARRVFLEASASGKLESALADLKSRTSSAPPTDAREKALEQEDLLRQESRRILTEACENGRLDEVLAKIPNREAPEPSLDDVLVDMRAFAAKAREDKVKRQPESGSSAQDLKALRKKVGATLRSAAGSGQLEQALQASEDQAVPSSPQKASEVLVEPRTSDIQATGPPPTLETPEAEVVPVAPTSQSPRPDAPPPFCEPPLLPMEEPPSSLTDAVLEDADPNFSLKRLAEEQKDKYPVIPGTPGTRYNEAIDVDDVGSDRGAKSTLQRQPSSFSEMKDDLLDGLKATIHTTVETSVNAALVDIRHEMQRRGAQADQLTIEMERLSRTVSNMQAGLASAGIGPDMEELS